MGMKMCCEHSAAGVHTAQDLHFPRPYHNSERTLHRNTFSDEMRQQNTSFSSVASNPGKLSLTEAFAFSIKQPVRFLSFSQRKYIGFRNQYEFDRKRLLVASDKGFAIIGYDIDEEPVELVNTQVERNEVIKSIGFVDDQRPTYLFLSTYN